jgi:hypothetical protein
LNTTHDDSSHVAGAVAIPWNLRASTHTFILYLSESSAGGETHLLRRVPGRNFHLSAAENILATVQPRLGRLLLFPHACPHAGAEVTDPPKLLLRGEVICHSFSER